MAVVVKSSPKVSIIIPVYNVEKYINGCLDSVIKQSYTNLEIILVDDGSTDSSGTICDKWAKKDPRINVIHKNNEGLNYARRSGYELATGEYVTFLDSDDLFYKDNIKNSLDALMLNDLDMVAYMHLDFSDGDEANGTINPIISDEYTIKRSTADVFHFLLFNGYENIYPMTAWGKLYKKNLLTHVDWQRSNMRAFEDNFFTPQIFDKVSSFAILKQQLYFYRRNGDDKVLSKTLTGNTCDGQAIGYLEYLDVLRDYWQTFFDKHQLDFSQALHDFWLSNMLFRLNNLIDSGSLCQENNIDYLREIIEGLQKKYEIEISHLNEHVRDLESKIHDLRADVQTKTSHLAASEAELRQLKTVRGSIRNAARQAKRRLTPKKVGK